MRNIRVNMVVAFLVLSGITTYLALNVGSFTGWVSWLALAGAFVAGVWALADLLALGNSFLVVGEADLWDTKYFKLMRRQWGDYFGGPPFVYDYDLRENTPRPLVVSTCRLISLTSLTFLIWTIFLVIFVALASFYIGGFGLTSYMAWSTVTQGVDISTNFFWGSGLIPSSNILSMLLSWLIWQIVLGIGTFGITFQIVPDKIRGIPWTVALAIAILWFAVNSILIFVVLPVQLIGVGVALKWAGISLAGIFALVVAVILGMWIVKSSKQLSKDTIGGILTTEWIKTRKEKFCPMIVQGEPFLSEQTQEDS